MNAPDPLIVTWQGRQLHVRHDDPHLGPYTPQGSVIRSAVELASDVDGLRQRGDPEHGLKLAAVAEAVLGSAT